MTAHLDYRENGVAAVYTRGETAWHKAGTNYPEGTILSLDQARTDAGQDFEVEKRPMKVTLDLPGGDTVDVEVPDQYAVWRTDRVSKDGILGVVGSTYEVLQNREAFQVLQPLLDAGLASLETGGTLKGGRDVWQMVRFNLSDPTVQDVFGKLDVLPFGLISNNHNGARKVVLKLTPIRVVCWNTLTMAHYEDATKGKKFGDAIAVRHTKNVKSLTVEAARELFIEFTTRMHVVAEQYRALAETVLSEEQFRKAVLDVIAPLPKAPKGPQKNQIAQKAFERATVRAEAKRDRLIFLRANGIGHTGDGSAWEAYQAVTQSTDHDTDLWTVKGESRVQSLYDGSLGITKQKALDSIYATVAKLQRANSALAVTG